MDEIVQEYLIECSEILDGLDNDLIALEQGSQEPELLARIFRGVHTVKGTSGFLGYDKLVDITHVGESLLDLLRNGELAPSPAITGALLSLLDAMRRILAHVEADGGEGGDDFSELVALLQQLQSGEPVETAPAVVEAAPVAAAAPAIGQGAAPREAAAVAPPPAEPPAAGSASDLTLHCLRRLHAEAGGAVPLGALAEARDLATGTVRNHLTVLNRAGAVVMRGDGTYEPADTPVAEAPAADTVEAVPELSPEVSPAEPAAPASPATASPIATPDRSEAADPAPAPDGAAPPASSIADSTIRVDVDLLDGLMNLVGELVLTRNQILQVASTRDEAALAAPAQHLNLLTTELQEGVMKTRMQPIGNVWNKFPRVVRDLAVECQKAIRIEMEGADTELDKTIIEAIKDPLTHLVRNACDHGIERAEAREAAGKAAEGRLLLRAFHEGGQVNIEIADDGAGIDPERIKAKAVSRGLVTQADAAAMGAREALHLVFLPGFSTAETVSNISGRGVGMDVVKTNIERIGGTVDVHSRLGHGTTFKIKIPLTLAIIPALIVKTGGSRFAIPQVNLLELVRLEGEAVRGGIETIHDAPVYRLRGKLLPLVSLPEQLGLGEGLLQRHAAGPGEDPAPLNIVVLQADDQNFGLVVDEVLDSEEIVVKPLSTQLKALSTYAGATIMGDGRVALILDVLGLADRAGVLSEEGRSRAAAEAQSARGGDRQTILLVRAGRHDRLALPLSEVSRLEEIPTERVERAGTEELVQYRGMLMPLVRLLGAEEADGLLQVIVCEGGGTPGGAPVGLVVDEVIDIVEDEVEVKRRASGAAGLAGVAVIQRRVTELIDVDHFVGAAGAADLSWGDGTPAGDGGAAYAPSDLLVAHP